MVFLHKVSNSRYICIIAQILSYKKDNRGERGTVERKKENQIFLFYPTPKETGFPQGSGGQAHLPPASFPSLS